MRSSSVHTHAQFTSDVSPTEQQREWPVPEECLRCYWIASGFLFVTVHLRPSTAALPALPRSCISTGSRENTRKFRVKVIPRLRSFEIFTQDQREIEDSCAREWMAPVGSISGSFAVENFTIEPHVDERIVKRSPRSHVSIKFQGVCRDGQIDVSGFLRVVECIERFYITHRLHLRILSRIT